MSDRCDFSDLPVESCGHCTGAADPGIPARYVRAGAPDLEARYGGVCGHCEQRYREGEVITLGRLEDGSEPAWCLSAHLGNSET